LAKIKAAVKKVAKKSKKKKVKSKKLFAGGKENINQVQIPQKRIAKIKVGKKFFLLSRDLLILKFRVFSVITFNFMLKLN